VLSPLATGIVDLLHGADDDRQHGPMDGQALEIMVGGLEHALARVVEPHDSQAGAAVAGRRPGQARKLGRVAAQLAFWRASRPIRQPAPYPTLARARASKASKPSRGAHMSR
jgi:hypothetical protein